MKFLEREIAVNKGKLLQLAAAAGEQQHQALELTGQEGAGQLVVQAEGTVEGQASALVVLEKAQSLQAQEGSLRQQQYLLQARLRKMQSSLEVDHAKYLSRVAVKIGAHLRKPQRKTRLEPSQEWERVRLTWQSFDRAQYVAVNGSDEELWEQAASPKQWRERLPIVVHSSRQPI